MRETLRSVYHPDAIRFQMRQITYGIENSISQAALPCGRAHAIENQGIGWVLFTRIVGVFARLDFCPVYSSGIQLLEKWPEPVGMFVVDSDRFFQNICVVCG